MVVSILGCGWYGKALAAELLKKGIVVKGSATSSGKLDQLKTMGIVPYVVQFETDNQYFDADFFQCDILVISIPPKVKTGEGSNYLAKIPQIIKTCVDLQVKKIIYISSTGVYGDCNCEVNELTDPNPDTASGLVLLDAERLFQNETYFKTTIIRFGGLIGPGRHPGRFFTGKTNIPNGLAPVNLIHQLDCVGITLAVIRQDAFGYLINASSPDHLPKADFYREMALQAALPIPEFIDELTNWKIVNSINLVKVLGYVFTNKSLKSYSFDIID